MRRIDASTADLDNIRRIIDGKYLIFKTSGSTGNPAVVLYDKQNINVSVSFFPHVLREKAPAGADIRPGIPGCAWRLYCPAR